MLSVIIITKNEAHNLERCLRSVAFADEIIVLDSGSTDNTISIAKQVTQMVQSTDWPGFGPQKNRALALAKGDWVLSIDADECLTESLQTEIKSLLQNPRADGYTLPRQLVFQNKPIRFGPGRDKVLRLVRRNCVTFTDDLIHERLVFKKSNPTISHCKQTLLHYSYRDLADVIERMNHYSSISAEAKFAAGKRGGIFKATLHGLWMFHKQYYCKLGFLDGVEGLILALTFAGGTFFRYLKLKALTKTPTQ